MNNQLQCLLINKDIQKIIIEVLIKHEYVTPDSKHFTKMSLTTKGKALAKEPIPIDMTFITEYRKLWPKEKNSLPSTIIPTYLRYRNTYPDHTDIEILAAAKQWIKDKEDFCGEAHYFFEKTLSPGVKDIRCARYVEIIRNKKPIKDHKNERME